MTLPGDSYTEREWTRVDLAPQARCWDMTANCGPDGDLIMINTYIDRGASFLSVSEARDIAAAIVDAARVTEARAAEFKQMLEEERRR